MSPLQPLSIAVVVVATTSSAFADHAHYTRAQDVKIEVTQSERSKPRPPIATPRPDRPELTASQALRVEGLSSAYRGQQEGLLLELIRDTPDTDAEDKAGYYFMLGELYAKQQRYWRLKSAELAIAADKTRDTRATRDAATAAATAKTYLVKAVKIYQELTTNHAFRNYAQMDVALFYYGYTLQSGSYVAEARKVFDQLLADYPRSKYVPEAHFAFAEYFFEISQYADAEARYRSVLKFPTASVYWYALYKVGWIALNRRDPTLALDTFYQVTQGTARDKDQANLHRAAAKDFVRAYAEVGKADKASAAFQRVDPKATLDMLAMLADLYAEQGKSDKAIYVYRELMTTAPTHHAVCQWQYDVVGATMSMTGATTADKVKEVENLVRLYAALARKQVLPAADAHDCHDNALAMAGDLARAYHSEAVKTKNPDTFGSAERLYRSYLDGFRDAPDHPQLEYYYAELLWSRADLERDPRRKTQAWELASEAFTRVVKRHAVDAKTLQVSAYAAVLGWKNALDIDPRPPRPVETAEEIEKVYATIPAELPIPPREQKMIDAFELYITYITDPNDAELVGMKFLEADTYRRYNHFAQAVPLFQDILAHHRGHDSAETAAQMLLDIYNRMQRYDAMLALADSLAADKTFLTGKDALVGVIGTLKVQSLRKQADKLAQQAAAANNNFRASIACGEAYLAIYNHDPEAAGNDEVLYNALVCYQDGKSIGASLYVYGKLKEYYPTSKLYARATARVGKAYGDIAFYKQAAETLEDYANKYAGEDDAYRALGEAVFFRRGLGDDTKAIEDTRTFVRMFGAKRPQDAANAMFGLTAVYEKRGDSDALIGHLRGYLRDYGDRFGADRRVIAYGKIGQALWRQSCPVEPVDGSCIKVVRERAISAKRRARSTEQPTQCGPEWHMKVTVIARDPRKVKAALDAFHAAEAEFEHVSGKTGGDEAGARYYYAQAKLVHADQVFESYLALAFPSNLDFDPARAAIRTQSLARFDRWLVTRTKIGADAKARYDAIVQLKDAATAIAAVARIGQISQSLSDTLFTAEIPRDVRTGPYAADKVEAFCDQMAIYTEPLDKTALDTYGTCLAQSTRLGWFSEWSRLCERELGQIQPDKFPTALELRAIPDHAAPVVASEKPADI
jgi:TolA-binding protein